MSTRQNVTASVKHKPHDHLPKYNAPRRTPGCCPYCLAHRGLSVKVGVITRKCTACEREYIGL